MRTTLVPSILLWPCLVFAAVLNVEFKFTPFTGDPAKSDQVETVAGRAQVFLNDVPIVAQEVRKQTVPVLFDEREIAASVWVPVASLGPAVRKGANTFRIEFEPADAMTPYRAQLRWASVTDQTKEEHAPGSYKGTNQADEGVDDRPATGKVAFGRTFTADFARDQPWHHYPAVTTLTDDDRTKLVALAVERVGWFKPDFTALYGALADDERVDAGRVRKSKCLDAAYKAGVRIKAPATDEIEVATTGHPEVVVQRRGGDLYVPDAGKIESIKSRETQECAGMALMAAYPPRLVVVRTPQGPWKVVY